MLTRLNCLLAFVGFCAILFLGTNAGLAQDSVAALQKSLREQATLAETDFAALQQGQTVVRLMPVKDKREVAVFGLVSLQAPADVFLQSYRESMTRKSNSAILEIGSFSAVPTLEDLQSLTFEDRDIDDMKECVVGDCKLKLSASMINRFHKEMDWEAPDYRVRASELLKRILLDYVRDYLARGDMALIEYNDKPNEVRLVEDQRALMAAPGYLNNILPEFPQHLKGFTKPETSVVEDAIVWSKFKFGLKPVIAINHIMVFKHEQASGPQILVASKQIYANHYFDSSLALTAFVNVTGESPGSYLIYENRSRTDGLEGAFSKIKRGIVEGRAVASLKTILEKSKANLNARALGETEPAFPADEGGNWRRWKFARVHVFLWLFLITASLVLFTLSNYNRKGAISRRAQY
ncbi:MAG TPA: hypothetical protein VGJ55_05435 [Pyrinomonadaceae bacterium]|jgi:hypothetical protein